MIVAARGASQVAMQAAAGGRLPFEGQLVPTCVDPPIELATDLSQGADQLEAEFLVQRDHAEFGCAMTATTRWMPSVRSRESSCE